MSSPSLCKSIRTKSGYVQNNLCLGNACQTLVQRNKSGTLLLLACSLHTGVLDAEVLFIFICMHRSVLVVLGLTTCCLCNACLISFYACRAECRKQLLAASHKPSSERVWRRPWTPLHRQRVHLSSLAHLWEPPRELAVELVTKCLA